MKRTFLASMMLKVKGNGEDFKNEKQKIIYYHSRLGSDVQKHLIAYLRPDGSLEISAVQDIRDTITRAWGNTDERENGSARIGNFATEEKRGFHRVYCRVQPRHLGSSQN